LRADPFLPPLSKPFGFPLVPHPNLVGQSPSFFPSLCVLLAIFRFFFHPPGVFGQPWPLPISMTPLVCFFFFSEIFVFCNRLILQGMDFCPRTLFRVPRPLFFHFFFVNEGEGGRLQAPFFPQALCIKVHPFSFSSAFFRCPKKLYGWSPPFFTPRVGCVLFPMFLAGNFFFAFSLHFVVSLANPVPKDVFPPLTFPPFFSPPLPPSGKDPVLFVALGFPVMWSPVVAVLPRSFFPASRNSSLPASLRTRSFHLP